VKCLKALEREHAKRQLAERDLEVDLKNPRARREQLGFLRQRCCS